MNEIAPRPLIRIEAEALVNRINSYMESARTSSYNAATLIVRFLDGEGWKALKYKSMSECIKDRFPWSERTFWRDVDAFRISERLGLSGNVMPKVLEPLLAIPAPEQAEVWEAARVSDAVPPSRAQVERAVQEHLAAKDPDVPDGATVEATIVGREPGDDDPGEDEGDDDDEPSATEAPGHSPPPRPDADSEEDDFIARIKGGDVYRSLPQHLQKRLLADSLAWWESKEVRDSYRNMMSRLAGTARRSCHSVTPRWIENQLYRLRARGPLEWLLCKDCDGKGMRAVAGSTITCSSCDQQGYIL